MLVRRSVLFLVAAVAFSAGVSSAQRGAPPRYPAMLLTAAESDSGVAPLHARKMGASLQAANAGDRPILVRIETRAGHGAGKPFSKQVDEQTDIWSFLFYQLGVRPPASASIRAGAPAPARR